MNAADDDRRITIERVISAPVERVWEAFTDPEHLVHWWGPDGFTNTFKEIDVREGGVWRFTMHGPDGTDYPNKIVYKEIVQHKRLVYDHSDDDGNPAQHFEDTITFEDLGDGSTKVTLSLLFATKEDRDETVERGAIEGGRQTLGRLEAYLQGVPLNADAPPQEEHDSR